MMPRPLVAPIPFARFAGFVAGLLLVATPGNLLAGAAPGERAPGSLARVSLSSLPSGATPADAATTPLPLRLLAKENAAGIEVRREPPHSESLLILSTPEPTAGCIARSPTGPFGRNASIARDEHVGFVRIERLVDSTLAIDDFLVDARSRGTRSVGHVSIPLVPVASLGRTGERIYAYRDDDFVHLLWRTTQSIDWRDARNPVASVDCVHAHVRLDVSDVNGPKSSAFATGMMEPTRDLAGKTERARFQLTASLSKSSRDPEPLLSVSVTFLDERAAGTIRLGRKITGLSGKIGMLTKD